jgi:hypothetical protein
VKDEDIEDDVVLLAKFYSQYQAISTNIEVLCDDLETLCPKKLKIVNTFAK